MNGRVQVNEATKELISALVGEYAKILGLGTMLPVLRIVNRPAESYLGQCCWSTKDPSTSTIELQQRILAEPRTLERVLAHEMVHHFTFMNLEPADHVRIRMGFRPPEHGLDFMNGATIVNHIKGEGFVGPNSDKSFVESENVKPFYLFIFPLRQHLLYAYAFKVTPQMWRRIPKLIEDGMHIVVSTNLDLAHSGIRFNTKGQWKDAKQPERIAELMRLYEEGPFASLSMEVDAA